MRLPMNEENTLVDRGIENLFPNTLVSPFVKKIVEQQGDSERLLRSEFDKSRKSEFADFVIERGTSEDFEKFSCLKQKLNEIRSV